VADVGGYAIREAIKVGATELEVSIAGRDAMEREIAKRFPDAEYRDTWVWFQSGINTDGAHNPVTNRKLKHGDILSLNCFPMISGYYTALERTLFVGEVDDASMRVWQTNIDSHEFGMKLLRPGASCAEITMKINEFLAERQMLQYRTFGYGHSFGVLSHYYGREAALELREDIDTVLEPGMVISMEPMLTIPEGMPGAGGYREHDIFVVTEDEPEDITHYPYGPAFNVVASADRARGKPLARFLQARRIIRTTTSRITAPMVAVRIDRRGPFPMPCGRIRWAITAPATPIPILPGRPKPDPVTRVPPSQPTMAPDKRTIRIRLAMAIGRSVV
jgi:hypothetical protein